MSLYAPRSYGTTTKKLEELASDPQGHIARYSNLSKRPYLPNNEDVFSDESSSKKKKIIIALLITLGMTQTLYLNISTFLPQFRAQYHPSINDGEVGIILSMFQLAYLIGAPLIGANLQRIGRKNCIVIGYLLIICATFGFGLLAHISNDTAFIAVAIILRFIQGFGDSCVSTAGYSIVTIEFPTKKESYIGYCQASVGLGLMLGPVIGQVLYSAVKYEKTFYIFAGLLSLSMIAIIFIIPQKTNHADEVLSKTEIDLYFERLKSTDGGTSTMHKQIRITDIKTRVPKISYWVFLKNRRAMMAAISSMMAMIFMLFFDSTLACQLRDHMHVSEDFVGYFFGLICLTYAISSPFVGYLIKRIPRRYVTCASFFVATLALFMFGPSELLRLPDDLVLQAAGLAVLGAACSVIFVPLLSEIIDGVQEKEGITEMGELNDKAAGIFNTSYAIGCIIAPILGGYLKMWTNFRVTCDIMALSSATYGVIYFIVAILPNCCDKKEEQNLSMSESPQNTRMTLKSKQSEHKKINPFNTVISNNTNCEKKDANLDVIQEEDNNKIQLSSSGNGVVTTEGVLSQKNLVNHSESLLFSSSSGLDYTANFDEHLLNPNKKN